MGLKKTIYLILTVILGIMLSFIAHSLIEISYLKWALNNNLTVNWYNYLGAAGCALPPYLTVGLLLIGAIGGYFLGQYWWRIVYIEKRRFSWKFNKKT